MSEIKEDLSVYNNKDTNLRKAQLRMLHILKEFDKICRKHKINYWLACGTLLGAKRHRGFIPWDDDVDVEVLQKDYRKLLNILNECLPSDLIVQSNRTDKNYVLGWAKIRDINSLIHEEQEKRYNYKYKGIFIDIFPVEAVPSMRIKKKIDHIIIRYRTRKLQDNGKKIFFYLNGLILPFCYLYINIARVLNKIFDWKYFTAGYGIPFDEKHESHTLMPIKSIQFEDGEFNSPNNVHQYLVDNFGHDYMILPSIENRLTHFSSIEFYNE